jgi:hypothetical protein
MNKRMLQQTVHRSVRIRPKARRVEDDGTVLPEVDDDWLVSRVDERALTMRNQRTSHEVELGLDNVKSFQSPNFLMLRCRITIGVPHVGHSIEPLVASEVVRPTPDEVLTQAVRDAAPSMAGWRMPKVETLLADDERRGEWFARLWRNEAQGACLPDPFTGSTNPYVHIPLARLREAFRKVADQRRAENFDPLDDWPT